MERKLDSRGRWRNTTVAFRASAEEAELINRAVALSGLTKREYIINKLLNMDVIVFGNPRVVKALRTEIQTLYKELLGVINSNDL